MLRPLTRVGATIAALAVALGLAASPASAAAELPVPSPGFAAVHGVVTPQGDGPWDPSRVQVKLIRSDNYSMSPYPVVAADGSYEFNNLYTGTYRISFAYENDVWTEEVWKSPQGSQTFTIYDGNVFEANGSQRLASTVSGTAVPPPGETLSDYLSIYLNSEKNSYRPRILDEAAGTFTFVGVEPGEYVLSVDDRGSRAIGKAYWSGLPASDPGSRIVVTPGSALTGFDVTLPLVRALSGTVQWESSPGVLVPAPQVYVQLKRISDGRSVEAVLTDSQGRWMHGGESIPPGLYTIYAVPNSNTKLNVLPTYWSEGAEIELVEAVHQRDLQIVLRLGGVVTVKLTNPDGTRPTNGASLTLIATDPSTGVRTQAGTESMDSAGVARVQRLEPGTYVPKLLGDIAWDRGVYPDGAKTFSTAKPVVVEGGSVVNLGTQVVVQPAVPVRRIAGADRYETSALVSKELFPSGSDIVYLVNGTKYADALAAGSAAIERGGGLLLVHPTQLPTSTAKELKRLKPDRIVIVGSAASISDDVMNAVVEQNPASVVQRLGGATRYETAALVVGDAFDEAPSVVLLTTGQNFPDALAAAPRAGRDGGAVLIVDGGASAAPAPIRDLLANWTGETVVQAVGNESSVSPDVLWDAASVLNSDYPWLAISPSLAGKDRWATAAALDADNSGTINNTVYIASGLSFPDALTVGPLVGSGGDRLVLARQNCIPEAQFYTFDRNALHEVVVIGGTGTLGPEVSALTKC
ncbi:hypothetical protein HDC94_002325 [Leifsonia sp. AK011]|uniref:cell wall-binding repeat-containing protein n=1 Tax=Leifsonia sp. AK011 TaxID=2723075 RepID=UPI0015CBB3FC|nr:cell wall-binding repeat-containing protein [Leifsonia sp. AK011]NYF11169.1 hypothetical protein [Leifsonia sp. AK011]